MATDAPASADRLSSILARRAQGGPSEIASILALSAAGGDLVDFTGGFPDPTLFDAPLIGELAAKAVGTAPEVALQYASNRGLASLRESLGGLLAETQGVQPGDDELIITSGGVDALTLVSKALLDPGDAALVESPTYLGACAVFSANEGVSVPMANDEHGLVPESLREAHALAGRQGAQPKFVYVIPDFQNPSGLQLPVERRRELVEIARELGVIIVEDVAYRDLAFDGSYLPSIYSCGPDVTVQVGTFSKTFSPGTRIGWACGPAAVIAAMAEAKTTTDQCSGALGQCILDEFIRGGHLTAALPRLRAAYAERCTAMLDALQRNFGGTAAGAAGDAGAAAAAAAAAGAGTTGSAGGTGTAGGSTLGGTPGGVSWTVPTGGFFTWVEVPGVDTKALASTAVEAGVAYVPGIPFFVDRAEDCHMRLSFSRTHGERMEIGIARLAEVIEAARG